MAKCVKCDRWLPTDQGEDTCSLCEGNPRHGKDNYLMDYLIRVGEREADRDVNGY